MKRCACIVGVLRGIYGIVVGCVFSPKLLEGSVEEDVAIFRVGLYDMERCVTCSCDGDDTRDDGAAVPEGEPAT